MNRSDRSDRPHRSLSETVSLVVVLAVVYGTVSLIENQLGANLIDLFPFIQPDNFFWFLGISVATLVLLIPVLIVVENAVADNPLSRLHWREWLKYFLEVLAGLLSAFIAILGNNVVLNIGPLNEVIRLHRPQSSLVLFTLLGILLVAVPTIRFWITSNNLLGIRDARKLLDVLEARADNHLNNHMMVHERRFNLDVIELPGAVSPLPLPETTIISASTFAPTNGSAGVNRVASGSENSSRNSKPRDEGITARKLREVFDKDFDEERDQRQLLVLGEPGGGKSTQLYLLCRQLVMTSLDALRTIPERRDSFLRRQLKRLPFLRYRAPTYRIPHLPVILDLSTWPATHTPLAKWIVDATVRDYGIHRRVAQEWMKQGRFLPLLDALDVMEAPEQSECVNEINCYLDGDVSEGGDTSRPLVVCCRMDEYQNIRDEEGNPLPLKLRHAVQLGLVEPEEVRERLHGAERLIADANQKLKLVQTLRVPLLLNLALLNLPDIIAHESDKEPINWAPILFKDYVKNMVRLHNPGAPYADIELALGWLGNELQRNHELVFLTSDLQRVSLPAPKDRERFDHLVARINGFLKLGLGTIPVIGAAAIVAKVYELGGGTVFQPASASPSSSVPSFVPIAIAVAATGILGALGFGMGVRNVDKRKKITLDPAPTADIPRTMSLEEAAKRTRWQRVEDRIIQTPINRWQRFVNRVILAQTERWQALIIMICVGLLVTLAIVAGGGLGIGQFSAPAAGLVVGMLVGGLVAPGGSLLPRWRQKQHPDHLYHNAARRSIRIFFLYTLVGLVVGSVSSGLLITAFGGQALNPEDALQWGLDAAEFGGGFGALAFGLSIGLDAALKNGGMDALLHFAVRDALKKSEVVPRNLVEFLEFAHTKTLLRREESGYTFIVRSETLRDFFADLYWTPEYAKYHKVETRKPLRHRHDALIGTWCPRCQRRRNPLMRTINRLLHIMPRPLPKYTPRSHSQLPSQAREPSEREPVAL